MVGNLCHLFRNDDARQLFTLVKNTISQALQGIRELHFRQVGTQREGHNAKIGHTIFNQDGCNFLASFLPGSRILRITKILHSTGTGNGQQAVCQCPGQVCAAFLCAAVAAGDFAAEAGATGKFRVGADQFADGADVIFVEAVAGLFGGCLLIGIDGGGLITVAGGVAVVDLCLAGGGQSILAQSLSPSLTQAIGDLAGGEPVSGDPGLTIGGQVAGLSAGDPGGIGVAIDHRATAVGFTVVATGIGHQIATAVVALNGDILGIAIGNGAAIVTGCHTAHDVLSGGDGGIHHKAVRDGTAGEHLTHDTGGTKILDAVGEVVGHVPDAQILHRAGEGAEKAVGLLFGGGGSDFEIGNGISGTVEGSGIALVTAFGLIVKAGGGDGGPLIAAHVDVIDQHRIGGGFSLVHLLHEPGKLCLGGDLISTIGHRGLIDGGVATVTEAVPVGILVGQVFGTHLTIVAGKGHQDFAARFHGGPVTDANPSAETAGSFLSGNGCG